MSPPRYSAAQRASAFAVHILTASGVGLGLLALLAAHDRRFTEMFLWLGLALLVDGIDGPLARRLRVREILPHWSGDVLDLVVDYLNYVIVPVYALVLSGLFSAPIAYAVGATVAITSALYFADGRMKTEDAFFRGFPAAWNLVVFYLLIIRPPAEIAFAVVALFCIMTFVPAPFLHPVRVRKLRVLTLALLLAWIALAATALAYDLSPPGPVSIALLVLAAYFMSVGFFRGRSQ